MKLAVADMDTTRDHFALNPWQPGERRIAFHLALEAAPAVHAASDLLQAAVAGIPNVRCVPREWLHLTMATIGASYDLPTQALNEVSCGVFDQWDTFASRQLSYDQVFLAYESLMLTARDDGWLHQLAQLQRDTIDQVLGPRPWNRLWPHTSVAYTTGATSAQELQAALRDPVASLPAVVVGRPTLTLIELRRDTGTYEWSVIRSQGPLT